MTGAAAVTDEFYGYLPAVITDASQCRDLVTSLVDYVQSNGPFDGVMGFSEGGIIAAMLLIEDSRHSFAGFKCGIIFSAALPLDPDVVRSEVVRCIDPDLDGVLLHVPTALIVEENLARLRGRCPLAALWGPGNDPQEGLVRVCADGVREVVRHDLEHQIPGSKSMAGFPETLKAIRRTIERAIDLFG